MSSPITVRELARRLGFGSHRLIDRLQGIGVNIASPDDFVDAVAVCGLLGIEATSVAITAPVPRPARRSSEHTSNQPSRIPDDAAERLMRRLMALANHAHSEILNQDSFGRVSMRAAKDDVDLRGVYDFRAINSVRIAQRNARVEYRKLRSLRGKRDIDRTASVVARLIRFGEDIGLNFSDLNEELSEALDLARVTAAATLYEHPATSLVTPAIVLAFSDALLRRIANDPRAMYDLEPRQFEELVAELFSRQGFDVQLTPISRDGGSDIIAVSKPMDVWLKFIIECKRYRETRKVDISLVQRLLGVKIASSANKAILATTSFFTRDARAFARDHLWDLDLKDYDAITHWLKPYRGTH